MNALTVALQTAIADIPSVSWQEAIEPFLNTLDSTQTRLSYGGDITEAMQRLRIVLIGEITAPMLTDYRAGLVACLDARGFAAVFACDPVEFGAEQPNELKLAMMALYFAAEQLRIPYVITFLGAGRDAGAHERLETIGTLISRRQPLVPTLSRITFPMPVSSIHHRHCPQYTKRFIRPLR